MIVCFVTLHVGLGTFQPIRVELLEDIHLHKEQYTLPESTAVAVNVALAEGRRVIAAGTTTVADSGTRRFSGRRRRAQSAFGSDQHLHFPGISIPRGEWAVDQLPPAAVEPADAGERLCGAEKTFSPRIAMRLRSGTDFSPMATACFSPDELDSSTMATTSTAKPPIFLLDSMSFIFRAYHAMQRQRPMSTRTGVPTAATYVFVNMINKLRRDFFAGVFRGGLRCERAGLSR